MLHCMRLPEPCKAGYAHSGLQGGRIAQGRTCVAGLPGWTQTSPRMPPKNRLSTLPAAPSHRHRNHELMLLQHAEDLPGRQKQ